MDNRLPATANTPPAMQATPSSSATTAELRRRAEALLRERRDDRKYAADTQRLVHELQVHQVELEMQNTALQEARDRMEGLVEKYADLYDFAPVGYFSVDGEGRVLEANLTGAALLGMERSRLIGRRLPQFVAPASKTTFQDFLEGVFAGTGKRVCEALMMRQDGAPFWVNFHANSAVAFSGPRKGCRLAVSDITLLKQAQEAQQRTDALTISNRELKLEIVRRQAVEEALRQSEQHQASLLDQSRHMQEQLRHLSHQLLQAQEEERRRISRELHDQITQTLVGINVHLETLAREAQVDPARLKRKIARTQRLVEASVEIVHRFARELRPTALDDLGLIATLHSFMKEFMKRSGVRVEFTAFAGVERLSSARRTVVYRVVQSALTNVAQHARASRAKVSIRRRPRAVVIEISDDGRSFDVARVLQGGRSKRLGLLGMRERVEMVGGSFAIESAPGSGTTVRAQIPFGKAGRT